MFHKLTSPLMFFTLLLIFSIVPTHAQEKSLSPDENTLSTQSLLATPHQNAVYQLANCDMSNGNTPCYVAVSASIVEDTTTKPDSWAKDVSQPINRNMILQCSVSVLTAGGAEMARFVQNTSVTFHSNTNSAPVTLNRADNDGTWAGALFRWGSLDKLALAPIPNPNWGIYAPTQAFVNSSRLGETGIYVILGWMGGHSLVVGTVLTINTSGWGCS